MARTDQLIETAERRRFVLEARKMGLSYREIAKRAESHFGTHRLPSGWDARYANKDVKRVLRQLHQEAAETAQEVRQIELERLDRMLRGLSSQAFSGDERAVGAALRIMERRARLLGLDRPSKYQHRVEYQDVDFSELSDEQLRRIIDGESPDRVLAEDDD